MLLFTLNSTLLPRHKIQRGLYMNVDNQRLKEIQQLKKSYAKNRDKAESMYDMFKYQHMIEEIEKEEIEILERNDVIL